MKRKFTKTTAWELIPATDRNNANWNRQNHL